MNTLRAGFGQQGAPGKISSGGPLTLPGAECMFGHQKPRRPDCVHCFGRRNYRLELAETPAAERSNLECFLVWHKEAALLDYLTCDVTVTRESSCTQLRQFETIEVFSISAGLHTQ